MTRRGALTLDEEQRAFHEAVPEWDLSVRAERERLGYRPEWRPDRIDEWAGSLPRPPYWEWRATDGRGLAHLAEREVQRLGLPLFSLRNPPSGFVRYWIACFLSDYDRDRLDCVRDWPPNLGGPVDLERVYPPVRQTLSVTVTARGGAVPRRVGHALVAAERRVGVTRRTNAHPTRRGCGGACRRWRRKPVQVT